jgi:hypothetical protein
MEFCELKFPIVHPIYRHFKFSITVDMQSKICHEHIVVLYRALGIYVCVYMCAYICVRIYVCVYMCAYICAYICVRIYVCVYRDKIGTVNSFRFQVLRAASLNIIAVWVVTFGPAVDSAANRNEYQEYFLGGKGDLCVGLTTLSPSCTDYLELYEP